MRAKVSSNDLQRTHNNANLAVSAKVAEQVDARVLEARPARGGGSSPPFRTKPQAGTINRFQLMMPQRHLRTGKLDE